MTKTLYPPGTPDAVYPPYLLGPEYTLPTATLTVLGGVKPDGTTITNAAGVISVTYGTTAGTAVQGNDSRIAGAASAASVTAEAAARAAADALLAPLASPALTGTPTAPTATPGTSTTQLATTEFVTTSPAFAGTPTAPTAAVDTNTTQVASTAFVLGQAAAHGLRTLFATGASVGNGADTTEDTLQSFTLAAGQLANVGDRIRIRAGGTYAASTDTKTTRLKVGGVNIQGIAATTAPQVAWDIDTEIMKTGSNTQSVVTHGLIAATNSAVNSTAQTLTDTGTIAVLITGQNSTNSVLNSITCRYMIVEFIR